MWAVISHIELDRADLVRCTCKAVKRFAGDIYRIAIQGRCVPKQRRGGWCKATIRDQVQGSALLCGRCGFPHK
nr:MAG TPA: hypothetical protein [Caudoviricetes sp.]DAQ62012.1 MAG TPA: hypothetical protein [Caudoviricetes sp.]